MQLDAEVGRGIRRIYDYEYGETTRKKKQAKCTEWCFFPFVVQGMRRPCQHTGVVLLMWKLFFFLEKQKRKEEQEKKNGKEEKRRVKKSKGKRVEKKKDKQRRINNKKVCIYNDQGHDHG